MPILSKHLTNYYRDIYSLILEQAGLAGVVAGEKRRLSWPKQYPSRRFWSSKTTL
jgi:hypothetical protein